MYSDPLLTSTLQGSGPNAVSSFGDVSAVNGQGGTGTGIATQSPALTNALALQPNYVAAPPTATAATVDPTAQIQQILAAFAPQAQQSNMNLNDALAAAGISGGPAINATQQLQSQLAAGLAPTLGSAIGTANSENQSAINNATNFNVSNAINTATGNASTGNNFEQFLASLQNGDWSQLLGDYANLNAAGLSGQQGINQTAAGNYGIQSGGASGVGALTGALGNLYGQSKAPTPTPAPTPAPTDPPTQSDGVILA